MRPRAARREMPPLPQQQQRWQLLPALPIVVGCLLMSLLPHARAASATAVVFRVNNTVDLEETTGAACVPESRIGVDVRADGRDCNFRAGVSACLQAARNNTAATATATTRTECTLVLADSTHSVTEGPVTVNHTGTVLELIVTGPAELRGNGSSRLLHVLNSTDEFNLTLRSSLVVRDFRDRSPLKGGGAILSEAAFGTLTCESDVRFINNSAHYRGGAVSLLGDRRTMSSRFENVTFEQCTADNFAGGGMYVQNGGSHTFADCVWTANTAWYGAGVFFDTANRVVLARSRFVANQVLDAGGLYLNTDNNVTITGCAFVGNFAQQPGSGAGVFGFKSNALFVSNTSWIDNFARSGAGVYLDDASDSVEFVSCAFRNNSGEKGGGMLINKGAHNLRIVSSVFTNNSVSTAGGGLFVQSNNDGIEVVGVLLEGNHASQGGAAYVSEGNHNISLRNTTWVHNVAPAGGAALYLSSENQWLQITESYFAANAADHGPVIHMLFLNAFLRIDSCTFVHNRAPVIYSSTSTQNMSITNCMFADNDITENAAANSLDGGSAVYLDQSNINVSIENCTFARNGPVSAVYLASENEHIRILQSVFDGNNGSAGGGAIKIGEDHTGLVLIAASVFRNNMATGGDGGAVSVETANTLVRLQDTTFSDNQALVADGGAIAVGTENMVELDAVSFVQNKARVGSGGALSVESDNLLVVSATSFTLCSAMDSDGGAVFLGTANRARFQNGTTFTQNIAVRGSALAATLQNSVTTQNCHGTANLATSAGSVYLGQENTLTMHGGRWTNNRASDGGVFYFDALNSDCTIQGVRAVGNLVGGSGGVAYLDQRNTNVSFIGLIAKNNSVGVDGGVLYTRSDNIDITIQHCELVSNVAGDVGGAIRSVLETTGARLESTLVSGNSATLGGALATGRNDEWLLDTVTLGHNTALEQGGALYLDGSEVVALRDSVLENNVAHSGGGGAVRATRTSLLAVLNSTLSWNRALFGGGGALALDSGVAFAYNSTVAFNNASSSGGGIRATSGSAVSLGSLTTAAAALIESVFNISVQASVVAGGSSGGGTSTTPTTRILGNGAFDGGGISAETSFVRASGIVEFESNVATSTGGAVVCDASAVLRLTNTSMLNNTAGADGGAVFVGVGSDLEDTNGTFMGNTAHEDGGAISAEDGADSVTLRGTRLLANQATTGDGGALFLASVTSMNLLSFSLGVVMMHNTAQSGGGGAVFSYVAAPVAGFPTAEDVSGAVERNSALYGPNVATTLSRLVVPSTLLAHSGEAVEPAVNVTVVDWYNQTVRDYSTNYVRTSLDAGNARCKSPKLAGSTVADIEGGNAQFESLSVTCDPGSEVDATFSVSDTAIGVELEAVTVVKLRECRLGQIESSDLCVTCGPGSFSWNTSWSKCRNCLPHASCPATNQGWKVDMRKGYWRAGNFSTKVRRCVASDACSGGTNTDNQCSSGSSGPLCLVCDPHYYQPTALASCRPCDSSSRFVPIILLLSLVAVALAMAAWIYYRRPEWIVRARELQSTVSVRVSLKIILVYVQIIAMFQFLFAAVYPSAFVSTSTALAVTNLAVGALVSPHCYHDSYDFYDTLLAETIGVAVLAAVLAAYFVLRVLFATQYEDEIRLRRQGTEWLLFISYLALPGVSTTIFQAFSCDDNFEDGESYLKADYSISCHSQRYRDYVVYACFMTLVYPVGIISLYAGTLWRHRHRICPTVRSIVESRATLPNHRVRRLVDDVEASEACLGSMQDPQAVYRTEECTKQVECELQYLFRAEDADIAPFKFLFEAYRPSCWYFEVVEAARRLLMSSMLIFTWPGSAAQIVTAIFVCAFFLIFYAFVRPYQHDSANRLMQSALGCTLGQLFTTLLLFENTVHQTRTVGVLMALGIFIAPLIPAVAVGWRVLQTHRSGKEPGRGNDTEADDEVMLVSVHTRENPVHQPTS